MTSFSGCFMAPRLGSSIGDAHGCFSLGNFVSSKTLTVLSRMYLHTYQTKRMGTCACTYLCPLSFVFWRKIRNENIFRCCNMCCVEGILRLLGQTMFSFSMFCIFRSSTFRHFALKSFDFSLFCVSKHYIWYVCRFYRYLSASCPSISRRSIFYDSIPYLSIYFHRIDIGYANKHMQFTNFPLI